MKMNDKGRLIVISGPSGAGKSTVVFKAIEGRSDMCFSTSVTTRKPRPNEVDGREYFFVDLDHFKEMVDNDELLEHAPSMWPIPTAHPENMWRTSWKAV